MTADEVWAVLVEECGARPGQIEEFRHHWPECGEFRFMGRLGFGGKVYAESHRSPWVGCYREDRTAARDADIERANARLKALGEAS